MLYKFKSEAGADVIMTQGPGQEILRIIGKLDSQGISKQGILLPEQMSQAREALLAAISQDELQRAALQAAQPSSADSAPDAGARHAEASVSLRRRAWPFMALIEASAAINKPIVWGV
jgi:hypothetical protein